MKIIGLEEHYMLPAIAEANPNNPLKSVFEAMKNGRFGGTGPQGEWPAGICDLDQGRIAAMDTAGIDVQILSHSVPGPETVEPPLAVERARQANDTVAAAVAKHPDRFRGFATLPLRDPAAAAGELERTVRELGFVGALINGHVNGRYLDDKFFWPVFCIPLCRRSR
jgi:predicted TIM-barrel fold metal-dependent hydrolase